MRHPLRFAFRRWFAAGLRRQCANAWAVAYVNESTLRRRYPPLRPGCHVAHYSSVDLDERSFVAAARRVEPRDRSTVVTIASLEQMYKAPDVLIDAVAQCVRRGTEVRLVLVGDGRHRPELEDRARGLGLGDRVVFRGQLPAGDAVRAELDAADLFVLPSRTEGLPRAMLEAMARGLPCLGSTAGGIPELLPPEDMVAPGDASALARAISEVLRSPSRMEAMSSRNLERARQYSAEILHARRLGLYRHLRAVAEEWRRTQGATSERQS